MPRAAPLAALVLLLLPACRAAPVIHSDNYRTWMSVVQPSDSERNWLQIPWIPTYGEGVALAVEQDRPLLVWVMNGHPLGCT